MSRESQRFLGIVPGEEGKGRGRRGTGGVRRAQAEGEGQGRKAGYEREGRRGEVEGQGQGRAGRRGPVKERPESSPESTYIVFLSGIMSVV